MDSASQGDEVLTPPPLDMPQAPNEDAPVVYEDKHPAEPHDLSSRELTLAVALLALPGIIFGFQQGYLDPMKESLHEAGKLPTLFANAIHVTTSTITDYSDRVGDESATFVTSVSTIPSDAVNGITRVSEFLTSTVRSSREQTIALFSSVETQVQDGRQLTAGLFSSSGEALQLFWNDVREWVGRTWGRLVTNWRLFLAGQGGEEHELAAAKEQLKAELRAELLLELSAASGASSTAAPHSTDSQQGIVVLPKTSDKSAAELRSQMIAESFSDEVQVSADETGLSGVVRPVFKTGIGDEYLYVLVPVTDQ